MLNLKTVSSLPLKKSLKNAFVIYLWIFAIGVVFSIVAGGAAAAYYMVYEPVSAEELLHSIQPYAFFLGRFYPYIIIYIGLKNIKVGGAPDNEFFLSCLLLVLINLIHFWGVVSFLGEASEWLWWFLDFLMIMALAALVWAHKMNVKDPDNECENTSK